MSRPSDDEPRSFFLSRGPSDIWLLFVALAVAIIFFAAPAVAPWIMRAAVLVVAITAFNLARSLRTIALAGQLEKQSISPVGTWIAIVVLAIWVWCLVQGFRAGKWIDAGLVSIVVAEFAYMEWLKFKYGSTHD